MLTPKFTVSFLLIRQNLPKLMLFLFASVDYFPESCFPLCDGPGIRVLGDSEAKAFYSPF